MTPDFEGFSIPDFIHYIFFPILIIEEAVVCELRGLRKQIVRFRRDCALKGVYLYRNK